MIEIVNEKNQTLELSSDFSLNIERNNPLFQTNKSYFQDITYPGKTGLTENNMLFIKSGHLVESDIYSYELPVTVSINGSLFFAGIFSYEIIEDDISFVLKMNFGAIAEESENTLITDIDYEDKWTYHDNLRASTIANPLDLPFCYFPTANIALGFDDTVVMTFVNQYDFENQRPFWWNQIVPRVTAPYFRLTYILEKICKHLGFSSSGSFFQSSRTANLYIYSQVLDSDTSRQIEPQYFIPNLSISNFFKALKERFQVNFVFNMLDKRVEIDEPNSLLKSDEINDISQYVASISRITRGQRKNYQVIPKTASGDLFPTKAITIMDKNSFFPLKKEKVEISSGTLHQLKAVFYDYRFPVSSTVNKVLSDEDEEEYLPSDRNDWLLRFVDYPGLKSVGTGKVFPEATALSFDRSDGDWYAFLNDSKAVRIKAFIPYYILVNLETTKKIGFVSQEGLFNIAIIEQISYALTDTNQELIETTIESHVIMSRKSVVNTKMHFPDGHLDRIGWENWVS